MRRRLVWIGLLLAACGAVFVAITSSPTEDPVPRIPTEVDTIRIVSANLWHRNSDPRAASVLADLDADLLVLRERTTNNLALDELTGRGWIVVLDSPSSTEGTHGSLILRAQSVSASASAVEFPLKLECNIPVATVLVSVEDRQLCVLGVHVPVKHACGASNSEALRWLADQIVDGRLRNDFGECRRNDPVMIAGDLNALPFSRKVRRFGKRGLVDAYSRSRRRPVGTWGPVSWMPKLFRVDYILVPRATSVRGTWVVDLPGSDHRAVVADLRVTR